MLRQVAKSSSRLATRAIARSTTRAAGAVAMQTYRPATAVFARQLHVSKPAFQLNANDAELVATLKKEIELETENDQEEDRTIVDRFLADSGFKVVSKAGSDLIELEKKDGGEVVHVYFSLFDLNNDSMMNEYEDAEDGAAAAAEEGENGENDFGDEDMESPIRAKVVIERPSGKALTVETTIHDDLFLIQYIQPHDKASLATENTAEADHARRQQYQGPVYSTLDPSLQTAIERYLETRGINSELATFILEYTASQENTEYISWLNQVKDVVSA